MEQSFEAVPPPDEGAVPAYPAYWEIRPRRLPLNSSLPNGSAVRSIARCRSSDTSLMFAAAERDTPTLVERRDAMAGRGPMSNWTRMIWTLVAVAAVLAVVVVLVIVLRK
jgi:hypothetical protein